MSFLVPFSVVIYGIGCLVAWIVNEEMGHPARELPGRIVLWPLFWLVWIYSAVTTGFVTLMRTKEKAATAAEDLEDEDEDDV